MSGHLEVTKTKNVTVSNGVLKMQAQPEQAKASNGNTLNYTSGFMYSQNKYTLPNYFRAEVRCKVPWQDGLWPAPLWFRPNDQSDGEIDLVESIGREKNIMHYTIHSGGYGSTHVQSGRSETLSDPSGWHTYVIEKTPNSIKMFRDGTQVGSWGPGDSAWNTAAFENPSKRWALWSNLQIGGSWAQAPTANTNWAPDLTSMDIDYIKTWVPLQ
jgi:beta-glucanase (GH16 family)